MKCASAVEYPLWNKHQDTKTRRHKETPLRICIGVLLCAFVPLWLGVYHNAAISIHSQVLQLWLRSFAVTRGCMPQNLRSALIDKFANSFQQIPGGKWFLDEFRSF